MSGQRAVPNAGDTKHAGFGTPWASPTRGLMGRARPATRLGPTVLDPTNPDLSRPRLPTLPRSARTRCAAALPAPPPPYLGSPRPDPTLHTRFLPRPSPPEAPRPRSDPTRLAHLCPDLLLPLPRRQLQGRPVLLVRSPALSPSPICSARVNLASLQWLCLFGPRGRRLLAGQLPPQGIHRAAAEGQRRLLPPAIPGGGSLGYSRQYGTFERCMRVGDLIVRATTAVSIISVSTAILALSVAIPVKMFRAPKKPQDMQQAQPSRCLCHQPSAEEQMEELRKVLLPSVEEQMEELRKVLSPSVEEKMKEFHEVLSEYEAQRLAQGGRS